MEGKTINASRSPAHEAIEQLCRQVENMPVGVPLPPVAQLRRDLAVSQQTIEKAYDRLQERGLIYRHRGKGVFRTDPAATGEFAIVLRKQLLGADATPAYRLSATALMEELQAENPQWHPRLHVGMVTEVGSNFPATLDLLNDDVLPKLRGVFSYHDLFELERELERRQIPVVHLSSRSGKYRVGADRGDFLRQCLSYLHGRGCRSVGLIWAAVPGPLQPVDARDELFKRLADEYGLEWHDEWIHCRRAHSWSEADGYNLFVDLWRQDGRPDGLVVTDDVLSHGVLRATLQFDIDLPRDLRLISFANRGVPLPYHKSVTRVEFDHHQWAQLAVGLMARLVRRQPVKQPIVRLPGSLIKGETA